MTDTSLNFLNYFIDSRNSKINPTNEEVALFANKIGVNAEDLTFRVINPNLINPDQDAPKINAIRISDKELKLENQTAELSIEIDFTDQVGINFDAPDFLSSITVGYPSYRGFGVGQNINAFKFSSDDLVKGSTTQGTLRKVIKIPANTPTSQWWVDSISMTDTSLNFLNYFIDSRNSKINPTNEEVALFANKIGVNAEDLTFRVINPNLINPDQDAPKINAIRISDKELKLENQTAELSIEIDFTDQVGINFDAPDFLSSITVGYPSYRGFGVGQNINAFKFSSDDLVKGSTTQGTLRKVIKIPANTPTSQWWIDSIGMTDTSLNFLNYFIDSRNSKINPTNEEVALFANKIGVNAEDLTFKVINPNLINPDKDAPKINAIRINSTAPSSTYTLSPSATTNNESAILTTSVATTNVASGTLLYYSLSGIGITTSDFSSGALTGSGAVGTDGKLSITHTFANDLTTEGSETLNIKLFSDSSRSTQVGSTASVIIADTSINPFNLDIDGDGKVTALGDGLMVIRKLFGAAFAGDALTNKAMSSTSTRTSAEIHQFIQQGITFGLLDVDKDGKTTALGDGLMVIRHLFGAAFAGAALTNKAISPDSPYFGTTANFAAVAANIDSMRPV
ncbi:hypothetical protein AAF134_07320 [Synechococcus lacustris Tous-12m]